MTASIAFVKAFVPLRFDPGEAYQFDWSHETIEFAGLPLTVKVAQMRLAYSRMPIVRAYFRETQEMVFDAHDWAFAFYGGTCRRGIYDNMRTAVETVFAELERALIQERVRTGLARARAQGKHLGRPRVSRDVEAAV